MTERKYANVLNVGYNDREFVLDFGQAHDGDSETQIHTGIVTTPRSALSFLGALRMSVDAYLAEEREKAATQRTQGKEDRD